MAFVYNDEPVAAHVGQFPDRAADRENAGAHPVFLPVVFPHRNEVLRADDQGFQPVIVLEDAGEGGCHERLSEPHDIADDDAAAAVQVMRRDLHGRRLEIKEPAAEISGNAEFGQAGSRLLGEVVGDFHVNVKRRNQLFPRPALVDDFDELIRNIHAPPVIPAVLEPLGELLAGIVVHDVDVQFALFAETRQGEVAAPEIADRRVYGVRAEKQVELGVKRVLEEQFDDHFFFFYLSCQSSESRLVLVARSSDGKLFPEFLRESGFKPRRGLVVHLPFFRREAFCDAQFFLGKALHSDQETAAVTFSSFPFFDMLINRPPAAQVEVPYAEVGAVGDLHGFGQRRTEILLNVVEDTRHRTNSIEYEGNYVFSCP